MEWWEWEASEQVRVRRGYFAELSVSMAGMASLAWRSPFGAVVLIATTLPASGFYLPGVAPIEYQEGAKVDLKVNKLTSTKTQLPYEWCAARGAGHS